MEVGVRGAWFKAFAATEGSCVFTGNEMELSPKRQIITLFSHG
jgi:hypothetical protein